MDKNLGKVWYTLISRYQKNKVPLDFNFRDTVLTYLGEKRSDVYTHYIHPYPGKIFPYTPIFWFSIPELCPPDGTILDPFSGSGTVLLESIVHPLYKRNAYGVEINPLGRLITKVKTTTLDDKELVKRFHFLLRSTERFNKEDISIPEFKNIEFWFSRKAIYKLSRLKCSIETLDDDEYKDFFWVCFSSIIRKVSKADPFIPPPVKLKVHKYKNSTQKYGFLMRFIKQAGNPDVTSLFERIIKVNLDRVKSLNKIEEIKKDKAKARIIWDDARSIKIGKLNGKGKIIKSKAVSLRPNSIDLILTSPPYLTAQKYIRTQKLELLWLGLLSEKKVADVEKESVGSERVSLKEIDFNRSVGVESIDSLINWTLSISPQRAATLLKYFMDMKQAILEMCRVLKNDSYAILVVGNNTVLGRNVETYRLLIDLAISLGFKLELVVKDEIRRRGMITKRHDSGGLIKEEFVIILKKGVE